MTNPLAKKNGVYVEKVADEVILYEKATHKAHCLNKTAAEVWEYADGSRSVDELASLLESTLNLPKDRDVVLLALQQLESAGLLEAPTTADAAKPSRRQIGRKLAMAGVSASLAPVIASVLAPTPAMASSPGGGISYQKYLQDLQSVKNGVASHPIQFSSSPTAEQDLVAGTTAGANGLILQTQGNVQGAQADFLAGQNDFNGVLKALGLPPLS
jgi:hypothetical protein